MEIKDKIEALKSIAQIHRSQFSEHRVYEWKVLFTTLSFYVLIVAAVYEGRIDLPKYLLFRLVIFSVFLVLALAVSTFLASLHTANNLNKIFAQRAEGAIADLIDGKEVDSLSLFGTPSNYQISWSSLLKRNIGVWAWRWQVIILIFFAFASSILIVLR